VTRETKRDKERQRETADGRRETQERHERDTRNTRDMTDDILV